jgi:capsular polysaccharide biosynthesis protein
MSPLRKYSTQIAKRWVVVAVLAAAGGVLATVWSMTTGATTWTATAALTSQSQERSPEQDGVLALGYVDYFNQDSYQQLLRAQAGISDTVELSAQTGASSPIIYIRASGPSEGEVRDAAANAAEVFREDVRESLVRERRQAADDLQAEIDDNVQELNSLTRTDVEKNVIIDQIRSLQGRLTEFLADNTNQLKQLQPEPGVSSSTPSPVVDVVSGVVGGAIVGILIALLLAAVDRRLRTADEVREATGLPVLAELGRGENAGTQTRLRNLLNGLAAAEGGATPVIAVAGVRSSKGASAFAQELVTAWSARRGGSLHVLADLRTSRPEYNGSPGLVEVLQGRIDVSGAAFARVDGQRVLPPGHVGDVDPYTVAETNAIAEVLEKASETAGLVVLEAPPILEAPEGQSICAAADQVILVIDGGRTGLEDVKKALALLASVSAEAVGIVIHHSDPGGVEQPPPVTVGSALASRARTSPFVPPVPVENDDRGVLVAQRPTPHPRDGVVAASSNGQIDADLSRDGTWQG